MYHFMIDGFQGFRSRFDQVQLVQEVLEEAPVKLGLQPAMPAFILPYYDGVVPEDCGLSSFVFLVGGHFTIHTFSFRETYFADFVSRDPFDSRKLVLMLDSVFPCSTATTHFASRDEHTFKGVKPDLEADFGPHLLIEIDGYEGPKSMDDLFDLFDRLPGLIGMTPIMRPYTIRGKDRTGEDITSVMTMVAESHISLHVFHAEKRAYFDLFSCSFFDTDKVVPTIKEMLPGKQSNDTLIVRGSKYKTLRTDRPQELNRSRAWLDAMKSA